MSNSSGKIDPPNCREDLVRKAVEEVDFPSAFDWIDERAAIRVTEDTSNRGLTSYEIRDLAREWLISGNPVSCVKETREGYRDRRHFHYDIVIGGIDGFPRGLYVEMELFGTDEDTPSVNLLNAHPSSGP